MKLDGPTLSTERLSLRLPGADDWPVWEAFARSVRAQYIGGPYDVGTAWRAFGHVIGHWVLRGYGSFIFTLKGSEEPLGMAGPWHPANWPEPEIGWTLWSAEAEGKGFAYEAAFAARAYAFKKLKWPTAVSYIDPGNARSIALARRLGATLDTDAATPRDDETTLVYRHPSPEALT